MKIISALNAKNHFGQLIEAAQRQPVTVTKQGRPSVVVMSVQDYQRRRQRAWRNLIKIMDATGNYAAGQGLTPEILEQLLADEG